MTDSLLGRDTTSQRVFCMVDLLRSMVSAETVVMHVQIRSDPNLKNARADEMFKRTIEKYDEPLLNENAVNALKSIFSFGKK